MSSTIRKQRTMMRAAVQLCLTLKDFICGMVLTVGMSHLVSSSALLI